MADEVHARAVLEVDTSQATEGLRAFNRELEKMKSAAASAGGAPRSTVAAGAAPPLADPYAGRSTAYMVIREFFSGIKAGLRGEEVAQAAPAARPAAAPAAAAAAAAAPTQALHQEAARVASTSVTHEFFAGIQSAFEARGTTVKEQFQNFVKTISHAAMSGLAALGRAVEQAAIVVTLVGPILAFAGALKLLRTSFEWAQEAAQGQLQVAGRTRRLYPQLVGEGVEAAEEEMRTRMGVATALFGGAADAMQEAFSRKTSEYRLGRGLRGERDIFARWGITPEGIRNLELTSGKRLDLTNWLQAFVLKREELERLLSQNRPPEEKVVLQRRMAQLMDDAAKIGGEKFADMVGVVTSRDVVQLTKNVAKAAPLGHIEKYSRKSVDFTIALGSLQGTFKALKEGISADVQPSITKFLEALNQKLLGTAEGGQGLGQMFRSLASTMADKAWEAMRIAMEKLTPERVSGWIKIVTDWDPKETAEKIVLFFNAIREIGKALWAVIRAVGGFQEKIEEIKGPAKKTTEAVPGAGREGKPGVVMPGALSPESMGGITPTAGGPTAAAAAGGFAPAPTAVQPTSAAASPTAAGAAPSGQNAVVATAQGLAGGGGAPTPATAAGPAAAAQGPSGPSPAGPSAMRAPGGIAAPAAQPAATGPPAAAPQGPAASGPPTTAPPSQPAMGAQGMFGGWQPPGAQLPAPQQAALGAGEPFDAFGRGAWLPAAAQAPAAVTAEQTAQNAIKATAAGTAAVQIASTVEQQPSGSMLALRISPERPTPSIIAQRQAAGFYQPPTPFSTLAGAPASGKSFHDVWQTSRDFFSGLEYAKPETGWGTLFEEKRAARSKAGGLTAADGTAWGSAAGQSIYDVVSGLSVPGGYAPTSYGITRTPKNTGGDTPTEA